MNYHHYCSNCLTKLSSPSLKNCGNCGYDLRLRNNKGYFIEFPIADQLKLFFKRKDFYKKSQYIFKPKEENRKP